jgi:hypothetical protein
MELITIVTVSNLLWKVLAEILLKYPRFRNIDSKRKQTMVVCKVNLRNQTLRNPNANCPGIDNGGVIFTISRDGKKCFSTLRSRYLRIEWFSSA